MRGGFGVGVEDEAVDLLQPLQKWFLVAVLVVILSSSGGVRRLAISTLRIFHHLGASTIHNQGTRTPNAAWRFPAVTTRQRVASGVEEI